MHRGAGNFIKGLGTGIAAGMTIYAVGSNMMRNNKNMRRKTNKAIKTISSIMDNVQYMMK